MIKLMFEIRGAYFIVTIDNKKILYWDKKEGELWGGPLQYLPSDPSVKLKIKMSRNKIPPEFSKIFEITEKEMEEFNNAKDDKELRDIVIKDCERFSCKLIDEKIT